MKNTKSRFALCICNEQYPASLELYKAYKIVPDAGAGRVGQIRVIDESGEDYLYPRRLFAPIRILRSWRPAWRGQKAAKTK